MFLQQSWTCLDAVLWLFGAVDSFSKTSFLYCEESGKHKRMIIIDRLLAKWECVLHRKLDLNWALLMLVSGYEETIWNCRLFNHRKLSSYSNIIWRAIWMTLWQSAIYQASDLSVSVFSWKPYGKGPLIFLLNPWRSSRL